MADLEPAWHSEIDKAERVKVCQHILGKLREFCSTTPEDHLKQRTRSFESQAYSSATSRQDYLKKIANGIGNIERHASQNQARQAIATLTQGGLANVQTQAAIRQQLRQHPEVLLRRNQLLEARQQHQLQLQARQALLQQHANSVKQQDPTRKNPNVVNRTQSSASDQKTTPQNLPTGKTSQAGAQNPSLANRGKGPNPSAAALDADDFRRKSQINGKQAAFSSAQAPNLANGAGLRDEYLMELVRRRDFPNGSQAQAQAAGQNPHQAQSGSQTQPQLPPGAIVPGVLSAQQQQLLQQQAGHPNSASISAPRASQAVQQQGVNRAGAVMHEGMMVDPQTKVDDRRAATVAAIATTAAAAGLNYTHEELRRLSQSQLQQIAHAVNQRNSGLNAAAMQGNVPVNQQVRRGDGQISASPHLSAGMGTHMASWINHFGNAAAAGGNSQVNVGVGQNPMLRQAMPLDERKQVLQHGSSSQTTAAASSGKNDTGSAATNPAGVTVPQMNEILARQGLKVDKSGNATQDKKAAIAEALQEANGVRSSQAHRSGAPGHLPAGGAVSGGVASSRAPSGQRGTTSGNASEEEFWTKLEDMRRKYLKSLKDLYPVIHRLQERHARGRREQFMQHLKDCFNILNMQRTSPISERYTLELLERAEIFIRHVVNVHTRYVKESIGKNTRPRKQQPGSNLDDYTGQVPGGAQHRPGIPSQAAPRLSAPGLVQQVKNESGLPQGTASELDVQRQQYAQIHQQRMEQQKIRQLMRIQQNQASLQRGHHPSGHAHGVLSGSAHADIEKGISKNPSAKGGGVRGRANPKVARGSQGLPISRGLHGVIPGQQQMQAPVQAHGQGQVVAAAHQAQVAVQAQAAATRAHIESQAAQAQQAQVQALAKAQAQSQRNVYAQRGSRVQHHQVQQKPSQAPNVRLNSQGMATSAGNQQMPQWGGPRVSGTGAQGTVPSASRAKRPELTIQQRIQIVDASVKEACEQAQRLESVHEVEVKRDKSERIQTTLAALRNSSSTTGGDGEKGKGTKRQVTLVDVDNVGPKEGAIKSKTVFECSSEAGLRLAKRPKNEAADLRSLREAVEADCKAAKERNPLLMVEIVEEFGLPVVTCLLRIPEIRLPKLVLRVQRGYPRKGGATYGFERPPMGWIGFLEEIRTRFKRALATAPAASVGVAAFLDAWATEADNVINGSCMSESG